MKLIMIAQIIIAKARQLNVSCHEYPSPIKILVYPYPSTTPKGGANKMKLNQIDFCLDVQKVSTKRGA